MSTFSQPFVVDIRDSPNHKTLEIEARTLTEAKIIADRYLRDRVNIVIIRQVKGLGHGRPMRWSRDRNKEWRPTAMYDQYAAGTKTPRKRKQDDPCLFTI